VVGQFLRSYVPVELLCGGWHIICKLQHPVSFLFGAVCKEL
jgi:hypothetical protein